MCLRRESNQRPIAVQRVALTSRLSGQITTCCELTHGLQLGEGHTNKIKHDSNGCKEKELILNKYGDGLYDDFSSLTRIINL